MLYARQISLARPTVRQMGTAFSVAAFVFLCIVFFHVFTTVYDYAPIIGPVFRDRFWLVYLLAGLGMTLPMLVVSPKTLTSQRDDAPEAVSRLILAGLAVFSVAAACLVGAKPEPAAPTSRLKAMTWNIQQGFDQDGNAALADQLRIIRSVDPDVLGLQESDTARISNGNVDAVRYFADQLGMYSYYGPSTTTGTFGIALLSKFPIESPRTFFMYSEGEQTAAILAEIRPDGTAYNVLVTHLGNGGPPLQLEDVLINVKGLDNVILMGDFNFSPASDQYVVISQRLEDAWFAAHPDAPDVPGLPLDDRIDLIFITPGMPVADASYSLTPESDHPFLYVLVGE